MTNELIIMNERIKLFNEGVLKSTGRIITIETPLGFKEIEEPEEINTFQVWKEKGYIVKKGQKAITSLYIWKHTSKTVETEDKNGDLQQTEIENMFLKLSYFFKKDQVQEWKR